jgi:DNA end-binding protein Ku
MLMLEPRGRGIMGTTLRYDYEVRDDKAYFDDIQKAELSAEMLDLASHIIDMKKARFDPSQFKDRYQDAVVQLIRAKRAGRPAQMPQVPRPSNVVNLMDALRHSLDANKAASSTKEEPGAKAKAAEQKSGARRTAQKPARQKKVAGPKGGVRKAG